MPQSLGVVEAAFAGLRVEPTGVTLAGQLRPDGKAEVDATSPTYTLRTGGGGGGGDGGGSSATDPKTPRTPERAGAKRSAAAAAAAAGARRRGRPARPSPATPTRPRPTCRRLRGSSSTST